MNNLVRLTALAVALLLAQSSFAGIFLNKVIVEFNPDGLPREDVTVFNDDPNENAFVEITVHEVVNPGTDAEDRVLLDDPQAASLLVTPTRMVIAPGASTQVRLVNLNENNSEDKVYRVTFTPVLPPLTDERSAVRIVVAYQALVFVPPARPESNLSWDRTGDSITFANSGNSYVRLESGQICDASGECIELEGRRLYAGNSWTLQLPFSGRATYRAVNQRSVREIQIDP